MCVAAATIFALWIYAGFVPWLDLRRMEGLAARVQAQITADMLLPEAVSILNQLGLEHTGKVLPPGSNSDGPEAPFLAAIIRHRYAGLSIVTRDIQIFVELDTTGQRVVRVIRRDVYTGP